MNFIFGLYDKLINTIIDAADIEDIPDEENEIDIYCETCSDSCKENCNCRCHYRSCGKCDNIKCNILQCKCGCHDDKTLVNITLGKDIKDTTGDYNSEKDDKVDDMYLSPKTKFLRANENKSISSIDNLGEREKQRIKKKRNTIKNSFTKQENSGSTFGFDSKVDENFIIEGEEDNKTTKKKKSIFGKFLSKYKKEEKNDSLNTNVNNQQNISINSNSICNNNKNNISNSSISNMNTNNLFNKENNNEVINDDKNKKSILPKRMNSKFGDYILGLSGMSTKDIYNNSNNMNNIQRKNSRNSVINLKRIDGDNNNNLNTSLNNSRYIPIDKPIIKFKKKKEIDEKRKSKLLGIDKKEKANMELTYSPYRSAAKKEISKLTNNNDLNNSVFKSVRSNNVMNNSFTGKFSSLSRNNNISLNGINKNNSFNGDNSNTNNNYTCNNNEKSVLGTRMKKSFMVNRISDLKTPDMLEDLAEEKFIRDKGKITNQIKNLNVQLNNENYDDPDKLSKKILEDFIQQPSWQGYSTMMFADIKIETPSKKIKNNTSGNMNTDTKKKSKSRPKFFS